MRPIERFGKTYGGGKNKEVRRRVCKECIGKRRVEWGVRNLDKIRVYQRRTSQRRRELSIHTAALMKSGRTWNKIVDAYRRTMAENPPELSSEEARLAYFRGYVAGSANSSTESAFIETHKDLAFRIASEFGRKMTTVISYEEAVSAAYRKLLELARKAKSPDRSVIAAAIRHGIVDEARSLGNRRGGKRGTGPEVRLSTDISNAELGTDFSASIPSCHDGAEAISDDALANLIDNGLSDREAHVLKMLSMGHTLREIGGSLGVTESRACGIVREIRERHGDALLGLLV